MSLSASESSALFRAEPERFIDAGIGEVAYRKIGAGPNVLFVHGCPSAAPPSVLCCRTWPTT